MSNSLYGGALKIYAFHYMKILPEKLTNNIFLYLMIHRSVRNQVYGCLQLTVNASKTTTD